MTMRYIQGAINQLGESRMEVMNSLTIGQFCGLPKGSEVVMLDIGSMGMNLSVSVMVVSEDSINGLLEAARRDGVAEDHLMPGSVFVYLPPEVLDLDMDSLLNEKFRKAGHRHGTEGAPLFSEGGLRDRFKEDWHDEAYASYTSAYKKAAESRRKGR